MYAQTVGHPNREQSQYIQSLHTPGYLNIQWILVVTTRIYQLDGSSTLENVTA